MQEDGEFKTNYMEKSQKRQERDRNSENGEKSYAFMQILYFFFKNLYIYFYKELVKHKIPHLFNGGLFPPTWGHMPDNNPPEDLQSNHQKPSRVTTRSPPE